MFGGGGFLWTVPYLPGGGDTTEQYARIERGLSELAKRKVDAFKRLLADPEHGDVLLSGLAAGPAHHHDGDAAYYRTLLDRYQPNWVAHRALVTSAAGDLGHH